MQQTTSRKILTSLTMVYLPQAIVPSLFALVIVYLKSNGAILPDPAATERISTILYSSIPAGIVASIVIYKQKLRAIEPTLSLREKMRKIQGAMLVRAACLEIPAFVAAITAFLSGELIYLSGTALMVMLLVYFKPTAVSISEDLQLNDIERSLLADPDAIIN